MGTFYPAVSDIAYPTMFGGPKPGPEKMERFKEVMGWVNDFMKTTGYAAGTTKLTVADISFLATYSSAVATENFDLAPYVETNAWFEKVKSAIPNYEKANAEGAALFGGLFKSNKQ